MSYYYGANHDLESLVQTHLFIICPNNSGSTFLRNALATSRQTWNMAREGQHMYGFVGPSTRERGARLIWASAQEWLDIFADATLYSWPHTCKAWYFQAFSYNSSATIFVTASPPFLLHVAHLQCRFKNAKFLFLVRNPYAIVEGIYRRAGQQPLHAEADILQVAATHVMTCFQYQRKNIETYRDCSIFFTYETMCAQSERIEASMQALVPELDDLKLRQQIPVKGIYDEMLRDMNEQQIARLSSDQLNRINQVFEPHLDLLDYFGYSLRK